MTISFPLFCILNGAWAQENQSDQEEANVQAEVTVQEEPPPIIAYLLVDALQVGELHTSIPESWLSFEVKISDWTPITCDNAASCGSLTVFGHSNCETTPIQYTVQTVEGIKQYWQTVSCVSVPHHVPSFRGQTELAFDSPRRKWR